MPLAGIQLIVHCIVLSSNAAPIAGGLARIVHTRRTRLERRL
jgi:hypothetical protein